MSLLALVGRGRVAAAEPEPSGVFFTSDWGTATGNSDTAITDGGLYDSVFCSGRADVLNVIEGDSVGWTKTRWCATGKCGICSTTATTAPT